MGSLSMREGDARGYEAYLEGRVMEFRIEEGLKDLEEEWTKLRRGWYLGGEGFLERLQDRMKKALSGRRRESHSGGAKQAHDEEAARQRLETGLKTLGVRALELESLPKAAPQKIVLAWWLRERTAVPLRWVSEHLKMGHYSRVTQAIGQMRREPGPKLERLKRKLMHSDKSIDSK